MNEPIEEENTDGMLKDPEASKLLRFKDKKLIMEKARAHLKNTSVYMNEDFSERLRKKRAELLPAMREARATGNYVIISYDRLIVRPKRITDGSS